MSTTETFTPAGNPAPYTVPARLVRIDYTQPGAGGRGVSLTNNGGGGGGGFGRRNLVDDPLFPVGDDLEITVGAGGEDGDDGGLSSIASTELTDTFDLDVSPAIGGAAGSGGAGGVVNDEFFTDLAYVGGQGDIQLIGTPGGGGGGQANSDGDGESASGVTGADNGGDGGTAGNAGNDAGGIGGGGGGAGDGTGTELGGTGGGGTIIFTIAAALSITSSSTFNVEEGDTAIGTVTATGDGPLYFELNGGADVALVTINNDTGVVSFLSAPDYEYPADIGANNVYNFGVLVTDAWGLTATQNIAVTVTNDTGDDHHAMTEDLALQANLADNAASATVVAQVGANGALVGAGNTSASTVVGPNGLVPAGLTLDGSNDYINFGNVDNLAPNAPFTISIWVKPAGTSPTTYQMLVTKWLASGTFAGWFMFRNGTAAGDPLTVGLLATDGTAQQITVPFTNTTAWRHIAWTNSGSGDASGMIVYENGVALTPTVDVDTWTATSTSNSVNLEIGARDGADLPYLGAFAGFSLFNRALSAAEVGNLYGLAWPWYPSGKSTRPSISIGIGI